jgi:hypothetical protein
MHKGFFMLNDDKHYMEEPTHGGIFALEEEKGYLGIW